MKKNLTFIILFMNIACLGCQGNPDLRVTQTDVKSRNRCPDKPKDALISKNVKSVEFVNESATASGQLRTGESLGYKIQGETGKILTFQTKEDICIWVYTPVNEILTDLKLPQTGQFVVQVATLQRTQNFRLQMRLSDSERIPTVQLPSRKYQDKATQTFPKAAFPKAVCGDSRPSSSSAYPVTFYSVQVPNTEANLIKARSQFCADAYVTLSKGKGEKVIQVAAFINQQDAKEFVDLINPVINGALVGLPTTIYRLSSK